MAPLLPVSGETNSVDKQLRESIESGENSYLSSYLSNGGSPNRTIGYGSRVERPLPLLATAFYYENDEAMVELIEAGADVEEAAALIDRGPLLVAATAMNLTRAAIRLAKRRPSRLVEGDPDESALVVAAYLANDELVTKFLEIANSAEIDLGERLSFAAGLAFSRERFELARRLITAGADRTHPVLVRGAILAAPPETIRDLFAYGADPNARIDGMSTFDALVIRAGGGRAEGIAEIMTDVIAAGGNYCEWWRNPARLVEDHVDLIENVVSINCDEQ